MIIWADKWRFCVHPWEKSEMPCQAASDRTTTYLDVLFRKRRLSYGYFYERLLHGDRRRRKIAVVSCLKIYKNRLERQKSRRMGKVEKKSHKKANEIIILSCQPRRGLAQTRRTSDKRPFTWSIQAIFHLSSANSFLCRSAARRQNSEGKNELNSRFSSFARIVNLYLRILITTHTSARWWSWRYWENNYKL